MVPPYPYCIEGDRHDVPMEDCWYARPQLFFTFVLRLKHGRLPKTGTCKTGPDDIIYTLVFFSTFEELKSPIKGPMEDAGVIQLYEVTMNHPQPPASTWLMSRIWWAELLCTCQSLRRSVCLVLQDGSGGQYGGDSGAAYRLRLGAPQATTYHKSTNLNLGPQARTTPRTCPATPTAAWGKHQQAQ